MSLETDVASIATRLEAFRKSDEERNALFDDLVNQYKALKIKYDEKAGDYDNELASRRMWQQRASSSEQALSTHKQQSVCFQLTTTSKRNTDRIFRDRTTLS
jgi:hypothetical protein